MAEIFKTIGAHPSRDYSSIVLWESDLENPVVYSAGDDAIGSCYNDSDFEEHVYIIHGGVIGLNSLTLTVASGERHDGTAGTGVRIAPTVGTHSAIINIQSTDTTFEWFDIDGTNATDPYGVYVSGNNAIVRRLLVHDINDADRDVIYGIHVWHANVNILNCIVYNIELVIGTVHGIYIDLGGSTGIIDNCTVYNVYSNSVGSFLSTGYSYYLEDSVSGYYRNLIGIHGSLDVPIDFYPSSFVNATVSNNMSSDATASGSGSLTYKSSSSQFVTPSTGFEDLHLREGSDAINTGADLGTTAEVNIDINGRDRDAEGDTWDIGAHEYVLSSSISLFISGLGAINENIDLYIKGYIAGSIYCYVSGYELINSNTEITLFTLGHIDINSGSEIPLYTSGALLDNKLIYLFVEGFAYSTNSYIPLFTYGVTNDGASGIYSSIPLIVYHDSASNKNITLFIKNIQTEVPFNENLNLFIEGGYNSLNANIPLYVSQEGVYADIDLYVKGDGTYAGASADSDSLSLYIYRPNISSVVPLIIYNNTQESNSYIPLYVNAILGSLNDNIPLVIPNVHTAYNSYIPLYMPSANPTTSFVTLVMPNVLAELNDNIPLIVWHEGGTLNSYVPLYSFGAYLINDSIPLVMPSILAEITGNTLLYEHGY